MASITKRGPYQYQAIIRRKGYDTQTKTFETRDAAEAWAGGVESKMYDGQFRDPKAMATTTLAMALERYMKEVTPRKRGAAIERNLIKRLLRHPLARRPMSTLLSVDFSRYRDERLGEVGPNTVRLELALFSHLYTWAIKEWSWPVSHLVRDIRKPSPGEGRERRLVDDEEARLFDAILNRPLCKAPVGLNACVRLALESGMRAGEILSLDWRQVDLVKGVIHLELTKNGSKRTVGLTLAAVEVLKSLPREGGRVIPNFYDTSGLDNSFKRACEAAGIEDLHFHDLRHEAASRFAPHMTAQELAKTMGWKTLQMAMRYYNPKDEEKVEMVRRREAKIAAEAAAPAARASSAWRVPAVPVTLTFGQPFSIPMAAIATSAAVPVRVDSSRCATSAYALEAERAVEVSEA